MPRIREVLRLKFQLGFSETQVASGAGIARTTVQDYLRRIAACGTNHGQLLALDDAALAQRLFPPREPCDTTRPLPDWESIERELRSRGVTLRLLWLEYLAENRGGYQYTQFLRHFHAWQAASRPPVMRFLDEIRPNKRERTCQAAFGWMRAVLQKDVDLDVSTRCTAR
jgi:transposase